MIECGAAHPTFPAVMAGLVRLVPAIHVEPHAGNDVYARDEPGHDEWRELRSNVGIESLLTLACF